MPSGVTSKIQASTSASGKPRITSSVTMRAVHSGRFRFGATVLATSITTQPTTR
jgi:hypothetical protein